MPEILVFKWKVPKLPKVIVRKLGKEQSYGLCLENEIHIDQRLNGKRRLEIELHEMLHWLYPDKTEEDIIKESRVLTEYLWKLSYRKTDNEE